MTNRPGDGRLRSACPLDCPDTRKWIVTLQNGKPTSLRGNPAREYPLALVIPADHHLLNSTFANVPRQQRRSGVATLLIHPDNAAARQITAGNKVRVANALGAFSVVTEASDRIRPGVVASTKGGWAGDSKQCATVNATVDERDPDMAGGAVYHDNRARVDRILQEVI